MARGIAGNGRRVWFAGGADIYAEGLPLASHLYLTTVGHHERTHLHQNRDCTEGSSSPYSRDCFAWLNQVHNWIDGDTRFPISYRSFYPKTLWERKSADSNFSYTFSVLSRVDIR